MKINDCGINQVHDKSFFINRPQGSGDYLFIYTRTPILLTLKNGDIVRYPAETTVFFKKGLPQRFMSSGAIYADDFIHFDADEDEAQFIESLDLPHGVPFTNLDSSYFLNFHRYICNERLLEYQQKDETVNMLLKIFLIKLSVAIKESTELKINDTTKAAFYEMRAEIFSNVNKRYTIEMLASKIGISSSYFKSTYKKLFGRSCMDDVIHARIEKARTLLISTDLPISNIARRCGYDNDSHFSRQFQKKVGVTASEYRKRHR